jgi:hypothetical protein
LNAAPSLAQAAKGRALYPAARPLFGGSLYNDPEPDIAPQRRDSAIRASHRCRLSLRPALANASRVAVQNGPRPHASPFERALSGLHAIPREIWQTPHVTISAEV